MVVIFETPRLLLRQFTEDDAPLIYNLNSDPDDSGSFTFWRVKGYTLNITRQGDPTVTLDMSRVPG